MARPHQRVEEPAIKPIDINDRCIGCSLCVVLAPSLFCEDLSFEATADSAYVHKQPGTEEEHRLCRELMTLCPTHAIEAKQKGMDNPR